MLWMLDYCHLEISTSAVLLRRLLLFLNFPLKESRVIAVTPRVRLQLVKTRTGIISELFSNIEA